MTTTRRNLLKQGAIFSAVPLIGSVSGQYREALPLQPDGSDRALFKSIALKAVDAAKSLGAEYADVRITRQVYMVVLNAFPSEIQEIAVGVRTLINGYWGFASSPYVNDEEVVRLATDAVSQSRINATGRVRSVDMSLAKPVQGDWSDPAVLDLLTVSYEELHDFAAGWIQKVEQYNGVGSRRCKIVLKRTEKVYATSEGTVISQVQGKASADFELMLSNGTRELKKTGSLHLPLATAGWEYVLQAKPFEQIPKLIEEAKTNIGHMVEPVDVGRYTVVFDASCTAGLLAATLGPATQLDRAMGFEANAQGTSFLNKPLESLGSQSVSAPIINITGDRTIGKGAATARWDDEGVECKSFSIIKDGTLADYQTNREQASWLSPYYDKSNRETVSNACVSGDSALDLPMQHMPNIVLHPGSEDASFEGLIGDVKDGIAISGAQFSSDFQFRHGGSMKGVVRKITNGKLAQYLTDAGVLFNTEELWKNVKYIGGKNSSVMESFISVKGEPVQSSDYSVFSVPMMVEDVSLIDVKRKA